jgi:hypothetical protein
MDAKPRSFKVNDVSSGISRVSGSSGDYSPGKFNRAGWLWEHFYWRDVGMTQMRRRLPDFLTKVDSCRSGAIYPPAGPAIRQIA